MAEKILVVYASKYGATAEIAGKIGSVLRQEGLEADVMPVDQLKDLKPYTAVVLGSAVYIGQWRKEAVKFLRENEEALTERTVWLFSSGPAGRGDPVQLLDGWRFPEKIRAIAGRIRPQDTAVFHGYVDPERLSFVEKFAVKRVKSPVGDYRDWEAIAAWAGKIAGELKKRRS